MREVTKYPSILYDDAASSLPKESFVKPIKKSSPSRKVLVVLDDDPTGTQTVHDISVLTTFETDVFATQLKSGEPGLFVLTNTRAYPPDKVRTLTMTLRVLSNLLNRPQQSSKKSSQISTPQQRKPQRPSTSSSAPTLPYEATSLSKTSSHPPRLAHTTPGSWPRLSLKEAE